MATRNGKISHLPNDIRERLNLRLLEGENGRELAAWLNALPEVQSVLGSQFNGSPISEVNLTHWRQGGYLQWLTERECFDSARALADADGSLAETGLTAERLLNILTVRIGQLLMRWDLPFDEPIGVGAGGGKGKGRAESRDCGMLGGVSRKDASPFSEVARKARILQGISRSVLAIHRIQSQQAREKPEPATCSANSPAKFEEHVSPSLPGGGLEAERKKASQSAAALNSSSADAGALRADSIGDMASPALAEVNGEVLAVGMERAEVNGEVLAVARRQPSQSGANPPAPRTPEPTTTSPASQSEIRNSRSEMETPIAAESCAEPHASDASEAPPRVASPLISAPGNLTRRGFPSLPVASRSLGARREILSGLIAPSSIPSSLAHTPFKAEPDLSEALHAV